MLPLLRLLLLLPPPRRNSALRSLPMVVEVEADTAAAAAEAVPPRRVREERPSSIVRACVGEKVYACVRACVCVGGITSMPRLLLLLLLLKAARGSQEAVPQGLGGG